MEMSNVTLGKEVRITDNQMQCSTAILVTLKSKGSDGWPLNFDINFLSLEDLEILYNLLDNTIREYDKV